MTALLKMVPLPRTTLCGKRKWTCSCLLLLGGIFPNWHPPPPNTHAHAHTFVIFQQEGVAQLWKKGKLERFSEAVAANSRPHKEEEETDQEKQVGGSWAFRLENLTMSSYTPASCPGGSGLGKSCALDLPLEDAFLNCSAWFSSLSKVSRYWQGLLFLGTFTWEQVHVSKWPTQAGSNFRGLKTFKLSYWNLLECFQ